MTVLASLVWDLLILHRADQIFHVKKIAIKSRTAEFRSRSSSCRDIDDTGCTCSVFARSRLEPHVRCSRDIHARLTKKYVLPCDAADGEVPPCIRHLSHQHWRAEWPALAADAPLCGCSREAAAGTRPLQPRLCGGLALPDWSPCGLNNRLHRAR